jgi:hypothetical protein
MYLRVPQHLKEPNYIPFRGTRSSAIAAFPQVPDVSAIPTLARETNHENLKDLKESSSG